MTASPSSTNGGAPALLEAALGYVERGWPGFPVYEIAPSGKCACGDDECSSPGKHPRIKAWPREATTSPERIQEWWTRWPRANIGVVTGSRSGIVVLDVDTDPGGDEALADFQQAHGTIPETVEVIT